jgi:hypothetical protein
MQISTGKHAPALGMKHRRNAAAASQHLGSTRMKTRKL